MPSPSIKQIREKMLRYANDAEILIEESRRSGFLKQSKYDAADICIRMANMYSQMLIAESINESCQ